MAELPPELLAEVERARVGSSLEQGPTTERAGTKLVVEVRTDYTTGVIGTSKVKIYQSLDDEDRGGVVIDIEIDNDSGGFAPNCEMLSGHDPYDRKGAIRITLLGDAESTSVLIALKKAIETIEHRLLQKRAINGLSISVPCGEPVLS